MLCQPCVVPRQRRLLRYPCTPWAFAPISVILVINLRLRIAPDGTIPALNHHTGLELSPLLSSHFRVPSKLDNATADAPTLDDCLLKSMSP